MTPEQLDEHVTAVLQTCVNLLPDQFDELWLVFEDEDGVSSGVLFFTDRAGPHRVLDFSDELQSALDDLVDAADADGQPIHRAVLTYRSTGGASADFDYDPQPGGVGEASNARFHDFCREQFGRSWAEVPEYP